jgi:tetratricopeptide (TPR) repeat protein
MKPIGTITNYFPFLEEETIGVLRSVMEEASDYYDFVVRLGNKVCDEDVPLELAYIAALHVEHAREWKLQEKLREKFKDTPEIVAWTFPCRSPADRTIYYDEFHEVLSRVIERNPPDWMLIDFHYYPEAWFCGPPSEASETLRKIRAILDRNPEFECFESYYHDVKGGIHLAEGDIVNSIMAFQKTLEITKKCDDIYLVMWSNIGLADVFRNNDAKAAIEYVEEANKIASSLCLPWQMTLTRNRMGHIFRVRGEYDMALECNFAGVELYYHDIGPSSGICGAISSIYYDIGDEIQALHWANEGFRSTGGKGDVLLHEIKSHALVQLGRLEEAESHLNQLHKLSLASAIESETALYLYSRGLYELKSGNPQTAIDSLEQALAIFEQINIQISINRCLIALTQAEIQLASESGTEDSSGPWMVRLESHARKKDYPGIQMHAALMRAEFLAKQGRKEEAQEVLQDALDILDSPSVKTLRKKIKKMIDELCVA